MKTLPLPLPVSFPGMRCALRAAIDRVSDMSDNGPARTRGILFLGPHFNTECFGSALADECTTVRPAGELLKDPHRCIEPAVLIADQWLAMEPGDAVALPGHVVVIAMDQGAADVLGDAADLSLAGLPDVSSRLALLRTAFLLSLDRLGEARARRELAQLQTQLQQLNRIGAALMTEQDRRALLELILDKAMTLTMCDLGILFLAIESPEGRKQVRFELQISRSGVAPTEAGTRGDVDATSIVGYAAMTGRTVVQDDIHNLPPDTPYRPHPIVTRIPNYWITSMTAIPMVGQKGDVVGVLYLANRKADPAARIAGRDDAERWVIPFNERDVELARSLAGQAAIAIENAKLLEQIEQVFDAFVKASMIAIDQRDPTTAGHSIRVAVLTVDLAAALDRVHTGRYRDVRLTETQMKELRMAALLHDFGKIGVREDVLVKAKKLPEEMIIRVESRFELIRCTMLLEHERERSREIAAGGDPSALARLGEQLEYRLSQLDDCIRTIRSANEPTFLDAETAAILADVARRTFEMTDGQRRNYLLPEELHYLEVPVGSLDERERLEIQDHAARTFQYLSHIPWLEGYRDIPAYASAHHEKLNGSGYPRHLTAQDLPVQCRIITIADIFDALTASDRPYRSAMSPEAALDIIRSDTAAGQLDPDLVQIMIDSEVYRHVLDVDWRQLSRM